MTGMYYHAQPLAEMSLANFLPGLMWNRDVSDLHLLSSWDYRLELPYLVFFILLFFSFGGTMV
jgi:hypothetical protein